MAIKFNATEKTARQDTFEVAPSDIKKGRNSRMIEAADYKETVKDRAVSLAIDGQLQPAESYRDADKNLVLSLGFTRYDAVCLLREGFDAIDPISGEEKHFHDPEARLWVKVVDSTPDEAFLRGIKENLERKDTTDVQEALAQAELRAMQGMTDTQIARLYGYTNTNRVAALSKLLTLPKSVQEKVHTGKLALYSALDTLSLSEDERAQVLDGSTNPKGRIEGAVLRKLIRDLTEKKLDDEGRIEEGDEEGEESTSTPKFKRTLKDFKTFVANAADEETFDSGITDLLNALVNWFDGKKNFGDKKLTATLQSI